MTIHDRIAKVPKWAIVLFCIGLWFFSREVVRDIFFILGYISGFSQGMST